MKKYSEKQVTSYTRAKIIHIENPLDATPTIDFHEEEVLTTTVQVLDPDGNPQPVTSDFPMGSAGSIVTEMFDPQTNANEEFQLLNSETGDSLGTMTYQEIQVALYSLYIHCATKRDNATPGSTLEDGTPAGSLSTIPVRTP